MRIKNFKDLNVWQKSMDLVVEIYRLIESLPNIENNALSNQMRRAAVSIPSNIAEGYSRYSDNELVQYLYIAKGSAAELETQLLIAERLGYFSKEEITNGVNLCIDTQKMINAFIKQVRNSESNI